MTAHEITLNCKEFRKANYDIVIDGLGWVSVQGKGFCSFLLYLPNEVKYSIREESMQPFEVMDHGLKKYHGNPINIKTRRNKKYSL